jgi:hypothetical protein
VKVVRGCLPIVVTLLVVAGFLSVGCCIQIAGLTRLGIELWNAAHAGHRKAVSSCAKVTDASQSCARLYTAP